MKKILQINRDRLNLLEQIHSARQAALQAAVPREIVNGVRQTTFSFESMSSASLLFMMDASDNVFSPLAALAQLYTSEAQIQRIIKRADTDGLKSLSLREMLVYYTVASPADTTTINQFTL